MDAEEQWRTVLTEYLNSEDAKMRALVGEILLVRAYILRGKSLYNQAIEVAVARNQYNPGHRVLDCCSVLVSLKQLPRPNGSLKSYGVSASI